MEENKYEKAIKDMAAFLKFAVEMEMSTSTIIQTLTHDICGLAYEKPCFLPRTSGYSDR